MCQDQRVCAANRDIFFSICYEQEECTKMGMTEQEGSLKCSDEPIGPRVRSTDTLEQEGVNNLKHAAIGMGMFFNESMNGRRG